MFLQLRKSRKCCVNKSGIGDRLYVREKKTSEMRLADAAARLYPDNMLLIHTGDNIFLALYHDQEVFVIS